MAPFNAADERFMTRALALAERARGKTRPNPMVGAVFVRGGKVIGEGYHTECGKAHAEVEALASAGGEVEGSTLYVTLEPCSHHGRTPPCVRQLVGQGIERIVVSAPDPNPKVNGTGIAALRQSGIKVDVGLLEERAIRLNEHFWTYHALGRPFVLAKWAMSLDGRTSTDLGESKWITNPSARRHVHQMRSELDAIMVGIGTVVRDDPTLNVRLPGYEGPQPLRVIVDGHLKIGPKSRLLRDSKGGQVLIATSKQSSSQRRRELTDMGHEVVVVDMANRRVDMVSLMRSLHARGVQSLLLEGGRQLTASMFAHGFVDKICGFIAPKILGGLVSGGPLHGWGIEEMGKALRLSEVGVKQFGDNICVEGYIQRARPRGR